MSISEIESQLISLLDKPEYRVIALSGKWGTGKTHLWSKIKKDSDNPEIANSLQISIFGLSSINEIKRKLLESRLPANQSSDKWMDSLKSVVKLGLKAADVRYKGIATLNEFNLLLVAPLILKDKLIVIDDIDRKHKNLGADELLGLIDEYINQHNSRFLLILNNDKISDDKLWQGFREKVIDHEIKLSITPAEAFDIAIKSVPSQYAEVLRKSIATCQLTNIRVIKKIIQNTNRLLQDQTLDELIQNRTVPSIVLLTGINLMAIENGPTKEFVLRYGSTQDWMMWADIKKKEEPTPEEKKEAAWRLLMQGLEISRLDDFDILVFDFLESGLLDVNKISPIIQRYIDEHALYGAQTQAGKFIREYYWNHKITESELLQQAREFPEIANQLDHYSVTEIVDVVSKLPDGNSLADEILNRWLTSFNKKEETIDDSDTFQRAVHPSIKTAIKNKKIAQTAKRSVFDVCMDIARNSSWGNEEELVMQSATVADFEKAIRSADVDRLATFLRRMIEMSNQPEMYEKHFGKATTHFLEACRNIIASKDSPRLSSLLLRVFGATPLAAAVAAPAPAAVAPPTAAPT